MAIAVAVAVAIRFVGGHAFPDYDATFALIWGHDLAHGHGPDYALLYRPAGHPLLTFFTLVVSPLGREGAADALRWLALLGGGFYVAALFRVGQAAFGTAAGVVAALLLATRTAAVGFPLLGYLDPLAAAFVLWALAAELRRPLRGGPVFALLALAGLIRPEAWLFAAVYWVWLAYNDRQRALRLLPVAVLGPLLWIAWDLVTSQTFLGSVSPAANSPEPPSSGGHGLSHAPRALVRFLGGFVRPPEAVIAAIGVGLALWWRDRRLLLPLALAALNVIAFVLVSTRKGPLEQRYLLVAAALALLMAAYAITELARGSRPARIAAIALAAGCVGYAPVDVHRLRQLRSQVRVANAADSDLRQLITAPRARCALRGRVHLDDIRLRPFIAYWAGIPPERLGTAPAATGALAPRDTVAQQLVSRSLPSDTQRKPLTASAAAPGLRTVAVSRQWLLTGNCRARQ